jgi:hypothetical protein
MDHYSPILVYQNNTGNRMDKRMCSTLWYSQIVRVLYQINLIYLIFLGIRVRLETAPTEWDPVNLDK